MHTIEKGYFWPNAIVKVLLINSNNNLQYINSSTNMAQTESIYRGTPAWITTLQTIFAN